MSEFCNILKNLRKSRGIMQKDVAKELGISAAAYSMYENGSREPSIDMIEKIADFFDVSPSYLMGWESKQYYLDDAAKEMAQFMLDNPEYRVLFDASRKVKKEDIEFVKQMIDRIKGDSNDTGC